MTRISIAGLCALLIASCSNLSSDNSSGVVLPTKGLIAEYLFNKGSTDNTKLAVPNGIGQNVKNTIDRKRQADKSLHFDGSTSVIEIPNDSASDSTNFATGDFTISVWVCTNANTTGGDNAKQEIICKGDPYNSGYALSIWNGRFAGFVGNTTRTGYNAGDVTVADSIWHHLVMTRDTAGLVQLYVDTIAQHSYVFSGSVSTADTLVIGKHGVKNQEYFSGSIDNLRIFDRALSKVEIVELFNDPY